MIANVVTTTCSECGQSLSLPPDFQNGETLTCPHCQNSFPVTIEAELSTAPSQNNPYLRGFSAKTAAPETKPHTQRYLKPCSDCGATISKHALKCVHCGAPLTSLFLLVIRITICALGVVALFGILYLVILTFGGAFLNLFIK